MNYKHLLVVTFLLSPIFGQTMSLADSLHPDNDHSIQYPSSQSHSHSSLEIPPGEPVPSVNLIVHSDPVWGWNLELQIENFEFVPENVNQDSSYREGHAHLYIDGEKVTRLYSSWYHIPHLSPGVHQIRVSLNGNGHQALVYQGQPIEDSETIMVTEK